MSGAEEPRRIAPGEIRRIAALAHVDLDEAMLERLARDLSTILDHVARLEALDLEGLPPHGTGLAPAHLRADVPRPSLGAEVAQGPSQGHGDGHFKVPRVID